MAGISQVSQHYDCVIKIDEHMLFHFRIFFVFGEPINGILVQLSVGKLCVTCPSSGGSRSADSDRCRARTGGGNADGFSYCDGDCRRISNGGH